MKLGSIKGNSTLTGSSWEEVTKISSTVLKDIKIDSLGQVLYINMVDTNIYYRPKNHFYTYIKEKHNIDPNTILSSKLLIDDILINENSKKIYFLEKKFQNCHGSVDEKLQTIHFKQRQLRKLIQSIGYELEYIYVVNDWFKKDKYKDVIEYIQEVGGQLYFEHIPELKLKEMFKLI
jgi:hypothetical protein